MGTHFIAAGKRPSDAWTDKVHDPMLRKGYVFFRPHWMVPGPIG